MLITRFLLVILFIITGLKLAAESGAVVYLNNSTIELASQSEEAKIKGKHESSKYDSEDKFHAYYPVYDIWINKTGILPSSLRYHKPYFGFTDKPFTPPDII